MRQNGNLPEIGKNMNENQKIKNKNMNSHEENG